ncbi:MAG: GNAT family N-acetyltransferase [Candidatus Bathyarchaeota archaeon]|nr:MAG: GNAT family N-acetyltransferase [Candidatus Bathyarchaeota archaeon]
MRTFSAYDSSCWLEAKLYAKKEQPLRYSETKETDMLEELKQNEFSRVLPLFRGLDYCLSFRATIEGNNPGRIFVDNTDNPRTALALTVGGHLLAGDHNNQKTNEDLRSFIAEQIFTGQVHVKSSRSMFLTLHPEVWEAKLQELIPTHDIIRRKRYHYACNRVAFDWRSNVPAGYRVCRIDRALLDDTRIVFPDSIRTWMNINEQWGTVENFLEKGISFCVLRGHEVVSWCTPDCAANRQIEVGIITHPEHRRKGLATVSVAATAEYCLSHGFYAVGWHCNELNTGSWKTAEKVGFNRDREYTEYFYTYDLVQHLGELAWHHFQRKDYEKSVHYFEQLFKQQEGHANDTYHVAAEAWAALKNKDKTLTYLRAAAEHGWKYLEYTKRVEAFSIVHDTSEWKAILARMMTNAQG